MSRQRAARVRQGRGALAPCAPWQQHRRRRALDVGASATLGPLDGGKPAPIPCACAARAGTPLQVAPVAHRQRLLPMRTWCLLRCLPLQRVRRPRVRTVQGDPLRCQQGGGAGVRGALAGLPGVRYALALLCEGEKGYRERGGLQEERARQALGWKVRQVGNGLEKALSLPSRHHSLDSLLPQIPQELEAQLATWPGPAVAVSRSPPRHPQLAPAAHTSGGLRCTLGGTPAESHVLSRVSLPPAGAPRPAPRAHSTSTQARRSPSPPPPMARPGANAAVRRS